MDRWMDGCTDARTDGRTEGRPAGRPAGQPAGGTDGRTDRQTDRTDRRDDDQVVLVESKSWSTINLFSATTDQESKSSRKKAAQVKNTIEEDRPSQKTGDEDRQVEKTFEQKYKAICFPMYE